MVHACIAKICHDTRVDRRIMIGLLCVVLMHADRMVGRTEGPVHVVLHPWLLGVLQRGPFESNAILVDEVNDLRADCFGMSCRSSR